MTLKTQQQLIHYTDYTGIEPAIVFVHGYTCDETDWVNQVRHFGAVGQRVITLDLPGHGKSMDCIDNNLTMKGMGRNVVTLLHHLQVTRAIVVGHSMGTIIATEIAVQSPDVVIGIALIDGSRFARGDPEEAVAKTNAGFEQMGFTRCIENTFMSMFRPSSDKKEKKRIIDRACAQPEATSIEILSSAIRWCASDFEYQYSQLKEVPVQVVQSTHREDGNKRVPVTAGMHIEWHRELKACGVDAEFDFVTDCGHFTMLDKPEVVNANIERLLERIDIDTAAELHNIHMFSSVSKQSN